MDQILNFFKLLSDETRLRIVVLLAQQDLCVCEIYGILDLSQPKVSKHLAKLRNMGFVTDERREQYIFYKLNINDEILEGFIKNIIENIDKYPQLSIDRDNLSKKDIYLNQCNTKKR